MEVTDPVCGMIFDIEKASFQEDYQGWAYFFCSNACHRRFKQSPERYVAVPAGSSTDVASEPDSGTSS